jgi:hypothetical protein
VERSAANPAPLHAPNPCNAHTDSRAGQAAKTAALTSWISHEGLAVPTPAAKELAALVEAAADNRRLRAQLEALRDAELELAAREADEAAANFCMLVRARVRVQGVTTA